MNGFLPTKEPLKKLPQAFSAWEYCAAQLPKLLVSQHLRNTINTLPPFPIEKLTSQRQVNRAMQLVSYLGHAYVFGEKTVQDTLPAILAKPWYALSQQLNRPPVLSYASYALDNWTKIDPAGQIALGNIALIQNFLGGIDEEWFILVHVDIEDKAATALAQFLPTITAVNQKNHDRLLQSCQKIRNSLERMCAVLDRMPEHCDPYIYYHRVRPYIHGWKNHPLLPQGLIYEGVSAYQGKPQQFRGETGAQSGIIPCMDALFGITHAEDVLKSYLLEMRLYMPQAHRKFLEKIERQSHLRQYIQETRDPQLIEVYNQCITLLNRFRQTHLRYAAQYIQHQHQSSAGNPNAVGTGGTPFMSYLKKHQDETAAFLL